MAAVLSVGGYFYFRLDDEICRHVERTIAEHYPDLRVRVGKARLEQDRGITVYQLSFDEPNPSDLSQPMLLIDELFLACDTRVESLLSGTPQIDRIVIRRPRLHANRLADGRWNLQALWPLPKLSDHSPEVRIEDATLTLVDRLQTPARRMVVRGIDIQITPQGATDAAPAARRLQLVGTATGSPARELTITGTIGPDDGWLDLTIEAHALEISPELVAAVPCRLPAGWDRVQISGTADATLRLSRTASANAPLEWSADVALGRSRLDSDLLPEPLTDMTVKLQADPRRLFIERLTGKFGTASVALACERHGWQRLSPMALAGRVVGLTVDAELQAALPAALDRIWQRFQPTGTVDAEVKLAFDGQHWRPELMVQCRGVSLTDAEKFPYRLEKSTGTIQCRPSTKTDQIELQIDLVAMGAGRPIQISAHLDHIAMPSFARAAVVLAAASPPRKSTGVIEISGQGIPIHERLLLALSDKAEPFVRSLAPAGTFDFHFRTERTDPFQLKGDTALELNLTDCAVRYDKFPYPLEHVRGRVTSRNGVWMLHDVTARDRQGSAEVTCRGQVLTGPNGADVQLVFVGDNVPLDENLKQALDPQVQKAWAELRPQGRVDFTARVERRPGQVKPVIEVELLPHEQTVSVLPTFFPYRFEQVGGRAMISAGKVELQQIRAKHGRSRFSTQGTWQATAGGGWQLTLRDLHADRLSPEPDLLTALPPKLRQIIEQLRPTGTFDLFNSTLSFVHRGDDSPAAASWDVNLGSHQTALRGDLPIEHLSGGVRLIGQYDGPNCRSYGELDFASLVWNDVQLTNVRGPFWADREYCLFGQPAMKKLVEEKLVEQSAEPRRITADLYGGSLAADVQLQHTGQSRFRADISLGGVQLQRIARERFGGPDDLTGTISGKLALTGAGRSTYALSGGGELHVVDANIYKLRPLVALLKVLRSRTPDTTAFNRCDMQFQIRGEDIQFSQLDLLGDAFSLDGHGQMNFNHELNLVFYTMVGPGKLAVPLWDTIMSRISEQALQIKVTGPLADPIVSSEPLPEMNKIFQQLRAGAEEGASAVAAPAAAIVPWPQPRR